MRRPTILAAVALGMLGSPASPAGTTQSILMKGIAFEPKQVTVHVGDALEWANQDIVAHTATAKDKSWDVNVLAGKNGRMVMKAPGHFNYICRYHPNMTGEVIVEPRQAGGVRRVPLPWDHASHRCRIRQRREPSGLPLIQ